MHPLPLPPATSQLAAAQLALLPIVPILLLPFILVVFVVVFPLWVAALAVLALLRVLAWPIDRLAGRLGAGEGRAVGARLARASHWVSSFGGLTDRWTPPG